VDERLKIRDRSQNGRLEKSEGILKQRHSRVIDAIISGIGITNGNLENIKTYRRSVITIKSNFMKQKLMEKISLGEKDLIDVTFLCG
jgi:hypothetical protein